MIQALVLSTNIRLGRYDHHFSLLCLIVIDDEESYIILKPGSWRVVDEAKGWLKEIQKHDLSYRVISSKDILSTQILTQVTFYSFIAKRILMFKAIVCSIKYPNIVVNLKCK